MADTTCRYGVASRMVQRVPDRGFRGVFLFSTPASALPACPSVRSVACIALQPKELGVARTEASLPQHRRSVVCNGSKGYHQANCFPDSMCRSPLSVAGEEGDVVGANEAIITAKTRNNTPPKRW
jgi:hypothetical protein